MDSLIQNSKIINQKLVNASPRCKALAAVIESELKTSQAAYKVVLSIENFRSSEDIKEIRTRSEQNASFYLQAALRDMKYLKYQINENECF